MVTVKMKTTAPLLLGMLILALRAKSVLAGEIDPPRSTLSVAPGEFSVRSIDEQKISPELKQKLRDQARLIKQHKVIPVSDHQVPDFADIEAAHTIQKKGASMSAAELPITFTPANIDGTSLRGGALSGGITHGILVKDSWTGLSRIFSHPHLGRVLFEETDLVTGGGGVSFTKEMINADINGAPAVILSKQGSEKKAMTRLTWFANGMLYELSAPRIEDISRDELLEIARQINH